MAKSKSQETRQSPLKGKKRVKSEKPKSIGLFDHVKHIRGVQDPNYYNNLSELDRKSFNHFIILQALSMDPQQLGNIAILYRFFDVIPSPQFYKLIISLIPKDPTYYPWIKSKKKYNIELVELVARRFEISSHHSEEYIDILSSTSEGMDSLVYICQGFGKSNSEIEELLSTNDDSEQ
jgi:hypothetical protein